jgi:hypothetical protein
MFISGHITCEVVSFQFTSTISGCLNAHVPLCNVYTIRTRSREEADEKKSELRDFCNLTYDFSDHISKFFGSRSESNAFMYHQSQFSA